MITKNHLTSLEYILNYYFVDNDIKIEIGSVGFPQTFNFKVSNLWSVPEVNKLFSKMNKVMGMCNNQGYQITLSYE